jgi:hypothetical protein
MTKKIALFITVILILSLSLSLPVQAAAGFTVSGKVSTTTGALAGVTITFGTLTTTTNASGNFTFSNVPSGTSGDLTPTKTGYTFDPVSIPITVTANVTGQFFTATQLTYSISGKVTKPDGTGLQGVAVFTAITDVNGEYTIPNRPYGSTTSLTPTKGGFTFNPTSISVPCHHGKRNWPGLYGKFNPRLYRFRHGYFRERAGGGCKGNFRRYLLRYDEWQRQFCHS